LPWRTAAVAVDANLAWRAGTSTGAAVFRIGAEVEAGHLARGQTAWAGDIGDLAGLGTRDIRRGCRLVGRGIRGLVLGGTVDADWYQVRARLGVHGGEFGAAARTKQSHR